MTARPSHAGEHDQDASGMLDEAEFEVLMAKLDIHPRSLPSSSSTILLLRGVLCGELYERP
jgi:hypothetical protein